MARNQDTGTNSSPRGLGAASKETRERVARMGGEARGKQRRNAGS